jgi:hypothetical protein
VQATFTWASSQLGVQWVDLSIFNNGFAPATFIGFGPLDPLTASITWEGLLPAAPHVARVNTLTPAGWSASNTLLFRTLDCGISHDPPPGPEILGLQARLEQRVHASGLDVAVAVTDLQTGESVHVNGDAPHLGGCTTNLLALLRTVMDLQEGRYPESWAGDLISSTIWSSNPITARELLLIARGGDLWAAIAEVNTAMQFLGMKSSYYDHPPAFPHESTLGRSNFLTANDMNRALSGLWHGHALSPPWRDYLLDKMTRVKPGLQYLIPAGVGSAVVSHKNGFLVVPGGWVDNDSGIVTFQRGGRTYAYAITFLAQGVPAEYADIPVGQAVSSLAWEYFSSRYR